MIAFPATASETTTYTYDALGRLVATTVSGGPNNGRLVGTCFDPAGNRMRYDVATSTISACPTPTPGPTPTPTPTNSPPTAVADSISVLCNGSDTIDLIANDSDPEGNLPLSLVSINYASGGGASAVLSSSTSVSVTGDAVRSTTTFSYVVQDSLGAQSTGTLSIVSIGPFSVCS